MGKSASPLFVKQVGNVTYLAIFNYSDAEQKINLDFSRLALRIGEKYNFTDLIAQKTASIQDNQLLKLAAKDALIFKITSKK
ncbi:hypothetical protein D3C73_1338220 [compost metagenome]